MTYEEWGDDFRLEIEIGSLEVFAAFCAILRGETIDTEQLRNLTARLRTSRKPLADAVRDETNRKP